MANLLSLLGSTANTLDAYDQVLQVTQNNVANASTPGYASQTLDLTSLSFDPPSLDGGVAAGAIQSSRDEYAEQTYRNQNTGLGQQQQLVNSLTALQAIFDISGNVGIPYALNNFFQSASAWAENPTSAVSQQQVIAQANNVAQAFQQTSTSLQQLSQQTDAQTQSIVQQVNQLVGQLQAYNQEIQNSGNPSIDSGMDANIHAALDNLSSLISFTTIKNSDGTTSIMLNGSTPLLIGSQQYQISASAVSQPSPPATYAGSPPTMQLTASDGTDITAQTTGGQLGALLNMTNTVLPAIQGGPNQAGALNTLAQNFADTVNNLLTSGNISDGPPPQPGIPLFTYASTNADGSANPTLIASSLAVNPSIAPGQLAAISPGPPEVSNGVALAIAQLATPTNSTGEIGGFSYSQYYGNIAADVGNQLQQATDGVQVQQSLVNQAQNQLQQISGVDINQQAMIAVEFQRAYEANSQLITILDQLTADTINILSSAAATGV
ncbi:MAG TPA: flagellar hook-associated protein FlgK [Bryobacteraceae bacterium]|nr:flagellar hook-associated protein FlgK [Bryobacteraceae bacterium]